MSHFFKFYPELVAMATSLGKSVKDVWFNKTQTSYVYHLVKKIVKIGPVHPTS